MDAGRKKSIEKKVINLVENAKGPFVSGEKRERFISSHGISYSFIDGYVDLLDDLIKDLLIKDNFGERFSEEHIRSEVEGIISKIIKDGNLTKLSEYIDQLADDHERYCQVRTVYVPLFGVELRGDPIKIGNITLRRMDDISTNLLIERISYIINQSRNDEASKQLFIKREIEQINKYVRKRTCALYEVGAEPGRALELAEKETQKVIDLLRYAIPALYSANSRVVIGLQGEYSRQLRYVPIISAIDDGFNVRRNAVGALSSLEMSPQNIDHMKKIGVFTLGNLLEEGKKLNDFDEKLLSSVEWFSRSQTQLELKNRLLNLITVMETFLTPGDNGPIQISIAEGVAILLDDDPIERKNLKERLKELYGLRSGSTHGRKIVILDSDVRELTQIAGGLIMVLIKMKDQYQFETKSDLLNWIEYRKLGGLPEKWMEYKEFLRLRKAKAKRKGI